ncbi:MAG: recombinase RecA [Jatrophihabitans sp.]
MAKSNPNRAQSENSENSGGVPGSTSRAHPTDGIPLPGHGFETLDGVEATGLPAGVVINRAASLLIGASAETLGLTGGEPDLDLDSARQLIDALAGLLAATWTRLEDAGPLLEGLRTLQSAFRAASTHPDEPGHGPGEHLLS